MFIDLANNDFRLQAGSPCIGTGRYGSDRGALPYQTDIKDNSQTPSVFEIRGNYPNPFNASTTISYSLAAPCDVSIEIFDLLGRRIESISFGNQTAGEHIIIWNADGFSSGVYFYKLTAGDYEQSEKMILLK